MNFITEAQAKNRWCPLVRALGYTPDPQTHNYPVNRITGDTYCIGSRCMAWRWYEGDNRKGYCGAFGPP